jgi:hypothetical protein
MKFGQTFPDPAMPYGDKIGYGTRKVPAEIPPSAVALSHTRYHAVVHPKNCVPLIARSLIKASKALSTLRDIRL